MDQIITRQEIWKYRKVFDGYEREWLKEPFKKLDIGVISEKVYGPFLAGTVPTFPRTCM